MVMPRGKEKEKFGGGEQGFLEFANSFHFHVIDKYYPTGDLLISEGNTVSLKQR